MARRPQTFKIFVGWPLKSSRRSTGRLRLCGIVRRAGGQVACLTCALQLPAAPSGIGPIRPALERRHRLDHPSIATDPTPISAKPTTHRAPLRRPTRPTATRIGATASSFRCLSRRRPSHRHGSSSALLAIRRERLCCPGTSATRASTPTSTSTVHAPARPDRAIRRMRTTHGRRSSRLLMAIATTKSARTPEVALSAANWQASISTKRRVSFDKPSRRIRRATGLRRYARVGAISAGRLT